LTRHSISYLILLAMVFAVVGCATGEETIEPEPPSFGPPLIQPLPLRVGYAFEPEADRRGSGVRLRLGPATRAAFGRVFAAAFTEAVDLAGESPPRAATDVLDGTIRLGVAAASAQNTTDGGAASATFELVFLNPDGAAAGSWQVRGGAAGSGWRSVELAVRAAAAEVAIRLGEQPAIRGWLERAAAGRVDPTKE
jgi:hypothetical protein